MKALLEIDPKYSAQSIRQLGDDDSITTVVQIVKTKTGEPIPPEEPLMLFRARDRNALEMLRYYREICVGDGCVPEHLAGIDNRIQAFRDFAAGYPERMKQPGITRGL
jgi:hypothetical protein